MDFISDRQLRDLYAFCNYSIAELYGLKRRVSNSTMYEPAEQAQRLKIINELIHEKEEAQAAPSPAPGQTAARPAGN